MMLKVREMNRALLILLAAVCLLLLIVPTGASTPVYGPDRVFINESGTYELMNDLTYGSGEPLIVINASDVVLDGQGHTIHAMYDQEGTGIVVNPEGESPTVQLSNVTIKNVNLDNLTYGIVFFNSRGCTVQGVAMTGNGMDIFLSNNCTENTISGNTFSDGIGIYLLDSCRSNTISKNTFTGCLPGIYMSGDCDQNTICENTFTGNVYGILISDSNNNIVKGNSIINSMTCGLVVGGGSGNTIYNNYFNNLQNVFVAGHDSTNIWNIDRTAGPDIMGGPTIGGNFWGTPDGTGFSQTDPDINNDGFCDDPYTIGTGNIDRYPLRFWPPTVTAGFYAFGHVGQAPYSVRFLDQSAGSPTAWTWDFGDGSTSTEQNPTHIYNQTGAYNVALTASNGWGSDMAIQYRCIIVNTVPAANFTANATAGRTPFTVQFTDQSTGASGYQWQFGDGTTSTEQNPVHTYTTPGSYTVTLVASGVNYGSVYSQKPGYITVTDPPTVGFSANVTAGLAPLAVQFNESVNGSVQYYYWQFGDGGTSFDKEPIHVYNKAGLYTVSFYAIGSNGSQVKTVDQYINVTSPVMPTPTTPAPLNTTTVPTTMVPTATVTPVPTNTTGAPTGTTVAPTATGSAYYGPHTIPGTLQAEDYDLGGEGVAYHDTTAGNEGGIYRHDDVDIEQLDTDHSPNVGWIRSGEWLAYTVHVSTAGTYDAGFRVASSHAGSSVLVYVDDETTPVATVTVPNTGDWPIFRTVSVPVILPAGTHRLKLSFPTDFVNINWITFAQRG
ncbi:PKD domain-containing protein [Methanosphaerula palustris]|uniref:Carbohydrate binding family 6 n=1 Tax=Methanosphaerula palustris (strain ATCC BAA-1556 / DSM 19958 / E1-9c) TaxID=521011 RepID=B8GKS8_METPE|nr:PKD domain-containing protein [Methanosphaerula palustris]ACL17224.1 Carbohydrate binding family 6 [Methanosphaerula palustris E1-9c]